MNKRALGSSRILTDDDVTAVLYSRLKRYTKDLDKDRKVSARDHEDRIRFRAVSSRCLLARERFGFSIGEMAGKLRVPQDQLRAIETGSLDRFEAEVFSKYISFLGLEAWFKRWKAKNSVLADKLRRPLT